MNAAGAAVDDADHDNDNGAAEPGRVLLWQDDSDEDDDHDLLVNDDNQNENNDNDDVNNDEEEAIEPGAAVGGGGGDERPAGADRLMQLLRRQRLRLVQLLRGRGGGVANGAPPPNNNEQNNNNNNIIIARDNNNNDDDDDDEEDDAADEYHVRRNVRNLARRIASNDSTLKEIYLSFSNEGQERLLGGVPRQVSKAEISEIASAMKGNTRLRRFNASSCLKRLSVPKRLYACKEIATGLSNCHLTTLTLSCNNIGDDGVRVVATVGLSHSQKLTHLYLTNNNIGDYGCQPIADALLENNKSLETLDLADNNIRAQGCRAISRALGQNKCCLKTLNLSGNPLGDDGIIALCDDDEGLVQSKTLTSLVLKNTQVGDVGCTAIAKVLRNNACLTSIQLQHNDRISSASGTAGGGGIGGLELRDSLKHTNYSMEQLSLWTTTKSNNNNSQGGGGGGGGSGGDGLLTQSQQDVIRSINNECQKNKNLKGTIQLLRMFLDIIPLEQWCEALVLFSDKPDLIFQTLLMKPELCCTKEPRFTNIITNNTGTSKTATTTTNMNKNNNNNNKRKREG